MRRSPDSTDTLLLSAIVAAVLKSRGSTATVPEVWHTHSQAGAWCIAATLRKGCAGRTAIGMAEP